MSTYTVLVPQHDNDQELIFVTDYNIIFVPYQVLEQLKVDSRGDPNRMFYRLSHELIRIDIFKSCLGHEQGCEVGVEVAVGVGRSRPFCQESELESVKFYWLRLRPGFAGYHSSTDNDSGQTVILRPENNERQEEKAIGSVEIKLKLHLVIEFRLI